MPDSHPQITARAKRNATYPALCCPLCKGSLDERPEAYHCPACDRTYPIVLGIPDFRVFPDPYIDPEDDYRKAEYILEEAGDGSFEDLVRFYWRITPDVSRARAERFMRRVFVLADAWREALPRLLERHPRPVPRSQRLLEIGCGTGGFLAAAREHFDQVIGVDIAFRWLVIARKQLQEAGVDVPLICACAEYLPFRDDQFDFIHAEATLEHLNDQEQALNEASRTARAGAHLHLMTANRFTLAPEPHVRVWGVGFLPRRWMSAYVELVKGLPYEHLRPVSIFELRRLLRRTGFRHLRFFLPPVPQALTEQYSDAEQMQVTVYDALRTIPGLRWGLRVFGPLLHAHCQWPAPQSSPAA